MHLLIEYTRQFGRFQRNARLYLISNALSGVSVGILLVLYNLYLVALGYGTDFIGVILLVGTLGAGLAIFPAGWCVDRFGGKAILIWSSLLIGVAGVGLLLFRQPVPLLVSSFIERSHLFSLNIVLTLVTIVLGKVIGGVLPVWFRGSSWLMATLPSWSSWLLANQPEARSYQLALLLAGIIAGPSLVPLFLLSNDRPPVTSQPVTAHSVQSLLPGLEHIQARAVLRSPIFLLSLTQVLIGLGAGLFIPYFNVYFVQHLRASSALFGLIDGGATAITALLTLAAPLLALRLGKVNTVVLTQLASIPLLLTIGLTGTLGLAALLYLLRQGLMELGGLIIVRLGYPPIFVVAAVCYLLSIAILWMCFGRAQRTSISRQDSKDVITVKADEMAYVDDKSMQRTPAKEATGL